MGYAPQTWANDDPTTPLSAERLTHIESGVQAAASGADTANASIAGHEGAVDPHGDRAYANAQVAAEAARAEAVEALKADLVAGKIPTAQIPAIATGQTVTVANQAAMLALTAADVQPGDVAIRSDLSGRRWILAAADPSVLASWIQLEVPDAVSSVNGHAGAVVLGPADVGADPAGLSAAETARAQAAEQTNANNLGDHLADPTAAHAASAVSVNPSGLAVVNTTDVQAALAQLDARVNANTQNTQRYVNDLIGNRPTPAVFGVGLYFARDDNLGTLYHSDGVTWDKLTAGIGWASGQQLAYAPINTISPVVNSNVASDVDPALVITIPASNVPVKVKGRIIGQQATGATAAVGSFDTLVVALTDATNNVLDFDVSPAVQVSLASKTWYHTFNVEAVLPAPFAGGTYKLRTYLLNALPTGWSASLLATGPTWPKAWLEAVAE